MENNRAIYHCICTLHVSIVIFGKVLMCSEIGLKFIASFSIFGGRGGKNLINYFSSLQPSLPAKFDLYMYIPKI
jgi:hypothetical protein